MFDSNESRQDALGPSSSNFKLNLELLLFIISRVSRLSNHLLSLSRIRWIKGLWCLMRMSSSGKTNFVKFRTESFWGDMQSSCFPKNAFNYNLVIIWVGINNHWATLHAAWKGVLVGIGDSYKKVASNPLQKEVMSALMEETNHVS